MRPRFSLRALFVLMTFVAVFCTWLVIPTLTAKRFLGAIAAENYPSADEFFINADDRFLSSWADKRWGFQLTGHLSPLTFGHLLRGHRQVRIAIAYFEFDQNMHSEMLVAATPLGLQTPTVSLPKRVGILIDAIDESTPRR